jgi:Domain of unknown function (DUF222)
MIIVSTTLQELESGCGQAVTAGGTLLPMRDVIRLASDSHHYLAVFDKHTQEPLYLGHAKRFATAGQRIVLLARPWRCGLPPSHGLARYRFAKVASSDLRLGRCSGFHM